MSILESHLSEITHGHRVRTHTLRKLLVSSSPPTLHHLIPSPMMHAVVLLTVFLGSFALVSSYFANPCPQFNNHYINATGMMFENHHRQRDVILLYDIASDYPGRIFPSRRVTKLPDGFITHFGFVQHDFICEIRGCTGSYNGTCDSNNNEGYSLHYYDFGYLVLQKGSAIVKRCTCGEITSENPCTEEGTPGSVQAACHMMEYAS